VLGSSQSGLRSLPVRTRRLVKSGIGRISWPIFFYPSNSEQVFLSHCMTADPIGKTLALMVECLTPLASWDTCHQLVLNTKDQYLGQLATEKKDTHSRKSSTHVASPQSPPTTPFPGVLYVICLVHLRDDLLRRREFGVGDPTSDSPSLGAKGQGESEEAQPLLFDYPARGNPCPVTWRACARSPT